jgi:outer membrane protein TolC
MYKLTKWLNRLVSIATLFFFLNNLEAQDSLHEVSLEKVYELARENYPLIKQKDLIARSSFLTIENIKTAYFPQVSLNGQATYQSDVTSIPVSLPGLNINSLSKDQYKIWGEVNQLIYDGGVIKNQKELQQRSSLLDDQKTEVELYKLHDRMNQLYLGILLLDAQLNQAALVKENANIGLRLVQSQVKNGTAFKSAQWVLEVQLLQTNQKIIEINNNRLGMLRVLELFIHQPVSNNVKLSTPLIVQNSYDDMLSRPELKLYTLQDSLFKTQHQIISSKNNPKISLFAQGGYGKPGFNQLLNDFAWYGIGGVRFAWSLNSFYTARRDQQVITINQKMNNIQKDVFVLNTNSQLSQQQSDIVKLQELLKIDEQIVEVRSKVTESAKAQLENGVINSNDYLREINAEDQARISAIVHNIQLLQSKINYQTIKGNQ